MLEFLIVRASDGLPLCELPGAIAAGSITTGIGWSEDFGITCPITDRLNPFWYGAAEPGANLLVVNDSRTNTPLMAGVIMSRGYGSGGTISIGAISIENWLKRVTVPNGTVRRELTDLIEYLGLGLLPEYFHGEVVKYPTNIYATRTYEADKATKRLDAMHDLMRTGEVEFCLRYRWDNDGHLVPLGVVADKIIRQGEFVFGGATEWSVTDDFSDGKGAVVVTASGTVENDTAGADANKKQHLAFTVRDEQMIDDGFPPTEFSFQPESSQVDTTTLKKAAEQKLSEMKRGITTVSIKTLLEHVRIGVDVQPGDIVHVDLSNPNLPGVERSFKLRMVGMTLETSQNHVTHISPILMEDSPVYSSSGGG